MAARGAPLLHMSGRCAALSTDQFSLDRPRTNPIATLTSKARQCYRSMPNARKTFSVEKYANAVTRQDSNKLSQNPRPTRINNGKAIKSVNDGNTSQKISLESPEIFCKSPLSRYSHTKGVDGVPNPRHSGGASKVGIHYADADVSLFFLADAFLFYQHHSAR